jgi:UDP-N-acetyl-D-mannosaminuronic acid dehydrogenase
MQVTVIGAGGHVGLPFSLVVAAAGHNVYGVDINEKVVETLNKGIVPYIEHGAEELLAKHLKQGNIAFTTQFFSIKVSDVIAVMLGTPVDAENNPRLDDLFNFIDNALLPRIQRGQLIILRSTISPGTTEVVKERIEEATGWIEGKDFYLVFCPERVLQTKGIEETSKLPALVGAFSDESYKKAAEFLATFIDNSLFQLTPREAEIAKLMTNMWRYVSFAFANEMYMIGDKHGVDIHEVIKASNYGYERMAVPMPGPNVGGPCLFKDGRFLLDSVPFADLIQVSFLVNEGMPDYIYHSITKLTPKLKNVLILGATFKANCDDTRNSLSFKMKKVLKKHGVEVDMLDPFIKNLQPSDSTFETYDAVIVMTPHDMFKDYYGPHMFRKDCIVADVWKMWDKSKETKNGIYRAGGF